MDRRTFLASSLALLAAPLAAEGQQARKVPVIGYLIERSGPTAFDEAFRLGLRELGYSEGRNVVVEYRWATGRRLPALAAELVRLKVDIIVTSGTPGGLAAKNATSTIPIVLASGGDFVADGLVASFSRPGANITGLSVFARELSGKRLEILKEAIPGMTRVAAAFNTLNPGTRSLFKETEAAATKLGLKVLPLDIHFPDGVERAFAEAVRLRASAVVIISDGATIVHRAQLGSAALQHHLPTIFANKTYLEGGGPHELWPGHYRGMAARRDLRRQDPQGRKAGRNADRTAHEVRAGHQPQDRQGARADDPSIAARAGG